jgi:phage tail sheath protein FI
MASTYKTPDVYVEEIPVFPPSVAEVGTAIPAFIGYTEKARRRNDNDLILKPTQIFSLLEYVALFGGPESEKFTINLSTNGAGGYNVDSAVEPTAAAYLLYYAVKMYFDNGGGQCYVVSVGTYQSSPAFTLTGDGGASAATGHGLESGLDVVEKESEPTLIVIPEAVNLSYADYKSLTAAVLLQCTKLGNRFAIFDAFKGDQPLDADVAVTTGGSPTTEKVATANRDAWTGTLKYGAAYYPFVKTTINHFAKDGDVSVKIGAAAAVTLDTLKPSDTATVNAGADAAAYNAAKAELRNYYVTMPPSGAVAGVYAATDTARGVWKAPANVALNDVLEPIVKLTNAKQEDLNVDTTGGKSINALRAFTGKGTLVWGARTLAGNDNEWRYVSVRRFFIMVEESVKRSTYWAVFEPNDANTWVKVRGMIENYLIDKWRDGALAGATPKDAFFVKCGLGTTMNAQDILEGRMNVEIGMAVVRPAEFIILKFFHKLQTS